MRVRETSQRSSENARLKSERYARIMDTRGRSLGLRRRSKNERDMLDMRRYARPLKAVVVILLLLTTRQRAQITPFLSSSVLQRVLLKVMVERHANCAVVPAVLDLRPASVYPGGAYGVGEYLEEMIMRCGRLDGTREKAKYAQVARFWSNVKYMVRVELI